jgi:hypothetical protein
MKACTRSDAVQTGEATHIRPPDFPSCYAFPRAKVIIPQSSNRYVKCNIGSGKLKT